MNLNYISIQIICVILNSLKGTQPSGPDSFSRIYVYEIQKSKGMHFFGHPLSRNGDREHSISSPFFLSLTQRQRPFKSQAYQILSNVLDTLSSALLLKLERKLFLHSNEDL